MRAVKGQVLTSTRLPAIRMRFDKSLKYVGSQKFILYERAQAEQHFFVDADARGRVRRMYMLQFEGYLPGIDASYSYEPKETVKLGGSEDREATYSYVVRKTREQPRPAKKAKKTRAKAPAAKPARTRRAN